MNKSQDLRGRCAVVTGAASGIGRALAEELAARGASLALIDVNAPALERAAQPLSALAIAADVRDEPAIAAAARRIEAELGAVELLFINAGVATVGPACTTPIEDVRWVLEVNAVGSIIVARSFVPAMAARRGGHVAFTASLAGLIGAPGMSAYSASKFALMGFAEALRVELQGTNVSVTTVCPGYVRTGLHAATRYHHAGFRDFLDRAPNLLGLTAPQVAAATIDAACAGQPLLTLGPERIFFWLSRISPRAYAALASRGARALGLFAREDAP